MKFQPDFIIQLVIVSSIFSSCEYRLDTQNFRNLQKPDSTYAIQVEITPEEFPEVLDEPVTIKYRFYPGDLSLLGVRILIDNYSWFESTNLQDSFKVYPFVLDSGNRKLSIEFITNSKSESLADITGYEAVTFRRDWEFYNPFICYSGICIKRVFNDNGMLKLEWDTTSLPGFRKYKVLKMWEFFDSPQVIAEFTDFYHIEYYDWEYFGGFAGYFVEVETENGTASSLSAGAYYRFPTLEVLWVRESDIMMYWNKSPFDKVLLGYELSYANSDTSNIVLFTTDNPMDTTYLLHGLAADKRIKYTLRYKIRGPEPGQSMWSDFTSWGTLTYKPKF